MASMRLNSGQPIRLFVPGAILFGNADFHFGSISNRCHLPGEIRQKGNALEGSDCAQGNAVLGFFGDEGGAHGEQLAGQKPSAFLLETRQRFQAEQLGGITLDLAEERKQTHLHAAQKSAFAIEPMDDVVSKQILIAQTILAKRNVGLFHCRKEFMQGILSRPDNGQSVPGRQTANTAEMEAAIESDEPVDLLENAAVCPWQSFQERGIRNGRASEYHMAKFHNGSDSPG
jgi:hypothetical protein